MELLDQYFEIQKAVHDYFGYVEDYRVIPLDDCREYFWQIDQEEDGTGTVSFADSIDELETQDGNCYQDEIYTQRFLPKWVYRGEGFTMVCCDPRTDGNKFLRVFDNAKERPVASDDEAEPK